MAGNLRVDHHRQANQWALKKQSPLTWEVESSFLLTCPSWACDLVRDTPTWNYVRKMSIVGAPSNTHTSTSTPTHRHRHRYGECLMFVWWIVCCKWVYLNQPTGWFKQNPVLSRTALAGKNLGTKTTDCPWITQIMMMIGVFSAAAVVVVVVVVDDDDDDNN